MTAIPSLLASLRAHRPLLIATILSLGVALAALIGLLVDPRELVGAPIWMKAFKFGVSIAIYTVTIAWMLALLPGRPRRAWWIGAVIAVLISIENVLIPLQILRGVMSHFNFTTPFDSFVVLTMGAAIVGVWFANLMLAVVLAFRRLGSPSLAAGVRWGVSVSLVGMAVAVLMTVGDLGVIDSPGDGIDGAHTVGRADGGPGLPVVGWSTVAGDLRAPHFVGIHVLQALPLLALLLSRLATRLPALRAERTRAGLVRIAGLASLGLIVLLTWQAARGQSVVQPDGATLLAAGALLAASIAAAALVLLRGRSDPPDPAPSDPAPSGPAPIDAPPSSAPPGDG